LIKRLGAPAGGDDRSSHIHPGAPCRCVADCSVEKEACPLNLAPTASTTAQLALGDALAVALLDARGFKAEDFARSHPGGALGRKLLTHVSDIMRSGDASAQVGLEPFSALMREMSAKAWVHRPSSMRTAAVLGIFTDGDLRRLIEKGVDLRALTRARSCTPHPRTINRDALAVEAAELMELRRITSVLVVLDAGGQLCGALNSQRPDARQGDLMTPALNFPIRSCCCGAGHSRGVFRRGWRADGWRPVLSAAEGETLKRFNTLDGHGIKLLQRAGITPA
jgi:arabinose-5-phosphate isomerase